MNIDESHIHYHSTVLNGFSGEHKFTLGDITIPVHAAKVNLHITFILLDSPSTYNFILGRPWIHEMRVVPSTFHQVIRFPTTWGVKEIRREQGTSHDCYRNTLKAKPSTLLQLQSTSIELSDPNHLGIDELDDVCIHPNFPDHKVHIGECLSFELLYVLIKFLKQHHNCFAWSHKDMTKISSDVVAHKVQVNPGHAPVKQKWCKFAPERNKVISEEVHKLLDIGLVCEVH